VCVCTEQNRPLNSQFYAVCWRSWLVGWLAAGGRFEFNPKCDRLCVWPMQQSPTPVHISTRTHRVRRTPAQRSTCGRAQHELKCVAFRMSVTACSRKMTMLMCDRHYASVYVHYCFALSPPVAALPVAGTRGLVS